MAANQEIDRLLQVTETKTSNSLRLLTTQEACNVKELIPLLIEATAQRSLKLII
jgi:hypothetical protein